ncbi:hypothetical protein BDN72DRAFT_890797 [Pluteus cervinus]|uniref:Uncharacterized protein n=1 Tax=Pluteus cervinus TaxID=181527 RepID=A0ACD3BGZ0_9AGAR|nr:hypothetical protein BDN72DRAFT_890797 [Pluteus cervinus]
MQQYYNPYVSSHYAQAYAQYAQYQPLPVQHIPQYVPPPRPTYSQMSSWYQTGSSRCSYKRCTFTGSEKSVEVHMMDRHLIYPPGWDRNKSSSGWDADPSLKGKRIPIQGTTLVLDTPEALEAWVEERKRRFPSAARVQDKKKRLNEAIARGQIVSGDPDFHHRKKRRIDGNSSSTPQNRSERPPPRTTFHPLPKRPATPPVADDDDSDSPPEALPSKPSSIPAATVQEDTPARPKAQSVPPRRPKSRPQPPRPLVNPFSSRPPLLRTLLLPEIRMTVSNLSQAIRFLVENDFLDNVELQPGQAGNKMIEEVTPESALVLPSPLNPANS